MIELKINGNRKSYQLSKQYEELEISLKGEFGINSISPIQLKYDNENLQFQNRNQLFQFSHEVRGASLDNLILSFNRLNFNQKIVNDLSRKNITEIGLFKAIFLIYFWIDMPLTNPLNTDFNKLLFNQFVMDWTNQPKPQQDIYFLDKKHISKDKTELLKNLIKLNLLARLTISSSYLNIESYFIPLIKPGVSRINFVQPNDPEGVRTYKLWNEILHSRDICISNWINRRY
jgi:hypothetical protein